MSWKISYRPGYENGRTSLNSLCPKELNSNRGPSFNFLLWVKKYPTMQIIKKITHFLIHYVPEFNVYRRYSFNISQWIKNILPCKVFKKWDILSFTILQRVQLILKILNRVILIFQSGYKIFYPAKYSKGRIFCHSL